MLRITMITSYSNDCTVFIANVSGKFLGYRQQKLIQGNLNRKAFIGNIVGSQNLQENGRSDLGNIKSKGI